MNKGFTLIEIMLAVALAAVIMPALVFTFSFSLKSAKQGEKYTKAYSLAQEQMEGVRTIPGDTTQWDWEVIPQNTTAGEYYQPSLSLDEWQLGSITTTPTGIGGFTKKVEISEVRRDGSGNISEDPWQPVDDYSRWIKVNITWEENGQEEAVSLVSLVTQH